MLPDAMLRLPASSFITGTLRLPALAAIHKVALLDKASSWRWENGAREEP